jgi:hypothetical protein
VLGDAGSECKSAARRGTNVYDFHGAKAPQVKRKARQGIEKSTDRMACELLKMATNDNVADSVKLAAIRDALDRAGLAARSAVAAGVGPPKPYEAAWSIDFSAPAWKLLPDMSLVQSSGSGAATGCACSGGDSDAGS